jgi:hypothetical protein
MLYKRWGNGGVLCCRGVPVVLCPAALAPCEGEDMTVQPWLYLLSWVFMEQVLCHSIRQLGGPGAFFVISSQCMAV